MPVRKCPRPHCDGHLELVIATGAIECTLCDYQITAGRPVPLARLSVVRPTERQPGKPVRLTFELPTEEQAWALAQFCKRLQWSQCREISESDAEAYEMIYAANELAKALKEAGFAPR